MESIIVFALILFVLYLLSLVYGNSSQKKKVFKNNSYSYAAKTGLMTKTETDFFIKLHDAVGDRYYVFPQVHLSALFDHRIKGQEWKYAFRHINGKSVDYVLCDIDTLTPTYAVELDDPTHSQPDRVNRDGEVNRIFQEAKLPLIRIKNSGISGSGIIKLLVDAKKTF